MPNTVLTPAQQKLYDDVQHGGESVIPPRSQTRDSSRARSAWIRTAKSLLKRQLITLHQVDIDTWKACKP